MLRWLGKVIFSFLLIIGLWVGGLFWFVGQIPTTPAPEDIQTDAIVILTGGSGRLEYGLQLFAEGKAKKLFISGVSKQATVPDLLRLAAPQYRDRLAGMTSLIGVGREAVNTIGNAEETARWLKQENLTSIRLVTSNYHMPRSVQEFSEIIPGIKIVPTPVFPDDFKLQGWINDEGSRTLVLFEYHKMLAGKLRHWFVSAHKS